MSNQNIWKASSAGNLDHVKHLVEVEKVNIESRNPDVR